MQTGEDGAVKIGAEGSPKTSKELGESQIVKTEEHDENEDDGQMDFEEEVDDEIQVYYENEEIEQAADK